MRTETLPHEKRSHSSPREVLKQYTQLVFQPRLMLPYCIFLVGFVAVMLGYTFTPKYLTDVRDLSPGVIGLLSSGIAAGGFFWNLVFSRYEAWRSFLGTIYLTGSAMLLFLLTQNLIVIAIAYFLLGALEAMRPVATGIIATRTRPSQQGVAFGVVDTLHGAGSFIAPGIAGLLYAHNANFPYMAALGLMPAVLIGVFWLLRREHRRSSHVLPVEISTFADQTT